MPATMNLKVLRHLLFFHNALSVKFSGICKSAQTHTHTHTIFIHNGVNVSGTHTYRVCEPCAPLSHRTHTHTHSVAAAANFWVPLWGQSKAPEKLRQLMVKLDALGHNNMLGLSVYGPCNKLHFHRILPPKDRPFCMMNRRCCMCEWLLNWLVLLLLAARCRCVLFYFFLAQRSWRRK